MIRSIIEETLELVEETLELIEEIMDRVFIEGA